MAYIKTIALSNGFEGNYWRLTRVELNKLNSNIGVTLQCYKDKTARLAGATPMTEMSFDVPVSAIDPTKDIYEETYNAVKDANTRNLLTPEFFFADALVD